MSHLAIFLLGLGFGLVFLFYFILFFLHVEIIILDISRKQQNVKTFLFNITLKCSPQAVSSLFGTRVVFFAHYPELGNLTRLP